VSTEWPEERAKRIRLERELAEVKKELKTKTQQLEVAERQVADLKALIEIWKMPLPRGAPEISDYYQS
jgi:hypothetical protein